MKTKTWKHYDKAKSIGVNPRSLEGLQAQTISDKRHLRPSAIKKQAAFAATERGQAYYKRLLNR